MNSIQLALKGGLDVLMAGLVFGAGIPVIYAIALRTLTIGSTEVTGDDGTVRYEPSLLGRFLCTILVAVVIAGVALGLMIIIGSGLGKTVSFENVFPAYVDKK